MDDQEFQNFLKSLSGLKSTATNIEPKNVERGAFGLPLAKQPAPKTETPSLTDSPTGKLPVIKQLTQAGIGIGTTVGKAGLGLGQTFLKGANVVGNIMGAEKDQYNPIIDQIEKIKTNVFDEPFKKELSSGFGKAGELVGDVALFAEGNAPIAKTQQYLSGATKGLNVANKFINYGLKKTAQVLPEAIGMGGIQYATSGGDAKEAGTVGVVSGVLSGLTHVGADVFRKLVPQTVKESVAKIFIPRGKMKLGGTENITDDAVGALQTIKNLAPDIKVIDKDGIEKAFIPEKATLLEMPQVLLQAKDKIYKAYSDLATKAGDAGAVFGQKDFNAVISDLSKYEGKGYTQAYSNKAKQIQEALNRYGEEISKNGKNKLFYFKDTAPDEIQTLIEAINRDVNPLSDKAGAEVALDVSRKLREILDDKISNATGEGYQQLRNAYKQLRAIEPEVINEFKKSLRGQGIQSDIIDKIATVDTITGLLSGNPVAVARGATWEAVKIAWRKALGNEANLQRAFKIMGKAEKENSALAQRLYANPSETATFKAGEKAVTDIKAMPNKEGGFISVGGKEFPKLNEVKVSNAPEGTSINVGLKTNVGGEITDQEVKDVLKKEFNVDVVEGAVHQSGTEPTLTAKLSRPLTDDELYKLTETLKQDAIPQLSDGVGKMTNIGKESWGDFNPEYFMDTTGKTLGVTESKYSPELIQNIEKQVLGDKSKAVIIDADVIKKLHPEYDANNPSVLHEESSAISKKLFNKAIDDDTSGVVAFTGGGSGSGKSEVTLSKLSNRPSVVFDGTLAGKESLKQKIDYALSKGKKVELHPTYTPPKLATVWNFMRKRSVPKDTLINTHFGFRETLPDILNEYGDKISIIPYQNAKFGVKAGGAMKVDNLKQQLNDLKMTRPQVESDVDEVLKLIDNYGIEHVKTVINELI